MKKPITLLLMGVMLLCATVGLSQQPTFSLTPSPIEKAVGVAFTVDVKVANFSKIGSMQYGIRYRANVLKLDSIHFPTPLALPKLDGATVVPTVNGNQGVITSAWLDETFVGLNLPNNTTLFTLHFKGLLECRDTLRFGKTSAGQPIEIGQWDASANNITNVGLAPVNSNVKIGTGAACAAPPPPPLVGWAIYTDPITGAPGETVSMNVKVQDFIKITSMQYMMYWDKTKLEYLGPEAFGLPDFTAASFISADVAVAKAAGKVGLIWYDQSPVSGNPPMLQGVTKPNGTIIYKVKFKILAPAGSTPQVTFGSDPDFPAEVANQTVLLPFQSQPATVTVETPIIIDPNVVQFIIDKDTVAQNGSVCVDVRVKNFTNIVAVGYFMSYDTSKLTFVNFPAGAANLPAPPTSLAHTPGEIAVSWTSPNVVTGLSLPDNSVFFTACFTSKGPKLSSTALNFFGKPDVPIEVGKAVGPNFVEVIPTLTGGHVYVSDAVIIPCTLAIAQDSVIHIKCKGSNNGKIFTTVTVANATGTPTYAWSGPTSGLPNAGDITGLKPGTYTVTVTLGTCPAATKTFTAITEPAAVIELPAANVMVGTPKCFGAFDGEITVTPTGGTAPYTYKWGGPAPAPSAGNVSHLTGIKGGTYVVTVTDANGCSLGTTGGSGPITVGQPSNISIGAANCVALIHNKCFGDALGSIVLNSCAISGGTQPYKDFSWTSPGYPGASTKDISGLKAGVYTLTFTDSNNCLTTTATITATITQPAAELVVTLASSKNVSCFGGNNGEACMNATGGTPPYTYNWIAGGPATACRTGLAAGSHTVSVTDANLCVKMFTVQIGQPTSGLTITGQNALPVSCFGGNDGSACVTATGGTPNYTYQWSSNSSSNCAQNLTVGVHSVTITDAVGCTVSQQVTVAGPTAAISISAVANVASACIDLTVIGGTGPYTYLWMPGGYISEDICGVPPGNYTVTVTDNKGCTKATGATLTSSLSANVSPGNTACYGEINGSCNVNFNGGVGPYTIKWDNGGPVTATTSPYQIGGLAGGPINVTVTDSQGIVVSDDGYVPQNPPISANLTVKDPTFPAFVDGNILIKVQTGTPPYTYQWSKNGSALPGSVFTTAPDSSKLFGQDEGMFCVTVTDAIGCTKVFCQNLKRIYPLLTVTLDATAPGCAGSESGAINATIAGGDGVFTINWSGPNGFTASTEDISTLEEGTYTVTVTDGHGQSATVSKVLIALSHIGAGGSSGVTTSIECPQGNYNICNRQDCTGTAFANVLNGFGALTYNWSNGETGQQANSLCYGSGSVTVTDAIGCSVVYTFFITAPELIEKSVEIQSNPKCYGDCNGIAQATAIGGVPPFSYLWSTGETGQIATKLCKGINTVTISDQFNSVVDTLDMVGADSLWVELEVTSLPTDFESCDGIVEATVVNGSLPIKSYAWNKQNFDAIVEDGCPGETVIVTIVDNNGCSASATIDIDYPAGGCLTANKVITPSLVDNKNDVFFIACVEGQDNTQLEVYNRWGQLVYEKSGYDNTWDGTYKGQPGKYLPEGVYFWVLTYDGSNGEKIQRKDYLNIVRGED